MVKVKNPIDNTEVTVETEVNGNGRRTEHEDEQDIVIDHKLKLQVIIPHAETGVCRYTELDEPESSGDETDQDNVEQTDDGGSPAAATDGQVCELDEDSEDFAIPENLKPVLRELCGTRTIRHLSQNGECKKTEDESSGLQDDSQAVSRRKRGFCRLYRIYIRIRYTRFLCYRYFTWNICRKYYVYFVRVYNVWKC